MAVPIKNNSANTIDKIKRLFQDYEFSVLENDQLASKAFCIFFGAEITAAIDADAKKQKIASILPTKELLADLLEITVYRKANDKGDYGKYIPMAEFFDKENPNLKLEYQVYQILYSMVMFDLKGFFQNTSNE